MRPKTIHRPGRTYVATVSRKGQITVPAALVRHLGWRPGTTRLLITRRGENFVVRRVPAITEETAGSLRRAAEAGRRRGEARR